MHSTALGWFATDTTALGILGAYQMHVLSTEQCRDLLAPAGETCHQTHDLRGRGGLSDRLLVSLVPALSGGEATATQTGPLFDSLLDVGAGEGRVSTQAIPTTT